MLCGPNRWHISAEVVGLPGTRKNTVMTVGLPFVAEIAALRRSIAAATTASTNFLQAGLRIRSAASDYESALASIREAADAPGVLGARADANRVLQRLNDAEAKLGEASVLVNTAQTAIDGLVTSIRRFGIGAGSFLVGTALFNFGALGTIALAAPVLAGAALVALPVFGVLSTLKKNTIVRQLNEAVPDIQNAMNQALAAAQDTITARTNTDRGKADLEAALAEVVAEAKQGEVYLDVH